MDVRDVPQAASSESPVRRDTITSRQGQSSREKRPAAVSVDKGPAKTIYSDRQIDDFLHEVRVEATVARLDLTHSAVWRLAMHKFMESHQPADVVHHFTQVASKAGQVGRPKR